MDVKLCTDSDNHPWDSYVDNHPEGTFFHLYGWRKVLSEGLGHNAYYFAALDENGKICGVLPLVNINSFLFGNSLSSLAFGSYGGAIADSPSIRNLLEQKAVEQGRSLKVGYVEYRYQNSTGQNRPRKGLYERFIKPILPSEEENMQAIRSKQRNIIRKGAKKGLVFQPCTCKEFYSVYTESVRNLGTPVFPVTLFEKMLEIFPDNTETVSAVKDGNLISSALVYFYKNEVCPYYWGGRFEARAVAGNDFLAWNILCVAAERGFTQFDFGRSKKDTGSRQWKINLGFEPQQLHYEYELIQATDVPDINPLNPKYRVFINAWKKLPIPISNIVGPRISRYLG